MGGGGGLVYLKMADLNSRPETAQNWELGGSAGETDRAKIESKRGSRVNFRLCRGMYLEGRYFIHPCELKSVVYLPAAAFHPGTPVSLTVTLRPFVSSIL